MALLAPALGLAAAGYKILYDPIVHPQYSSLQNEQVIRVQDNSGYQPPTNRLWPDNDDLSDPNRIGGGFDPNTGHKDSPFTFKMKYIDEEPQPKAPSKKIPSIVYI